MSLPGLYKEMLHASSPAVILKDSYQAEVPRWIKANVLLSETPKCLTEVQFELGTLTVTELLHFGSTGLRSRPSHRLKEGAVACREFVAFRNSGSVEETLNRPESLLVKRRNSQSERFDIRVKLSVPYCAMIIP